MNMTTNKVLRALDKVFPLFIICTLFSIVFLAPWIKYACKDTMLTSAGFMYVLLAGLLGLGMVFAIHVLRNRKIRGVLATDKSFNVCLAVCVVFTGILQFYIVRGGWFKTGWDAAKLTNVWHIDEDLFYYSYYPNQQLLAALFDKIARLGTMLGQDETYLSLITAACVCATASVVLASLAAKGAFGYACGYLTLGISTVLLALSPWILVPYSDIFSVPFSCFILFAYVCLDQTWAKWPVIVFATIMGYQIKPTIIFVSMAVVAVSFVRLCRRNRASQAPWVSSCKVGQLCKKVLLVVLAVSLAFGTTAYIKGDKFRDVNPEQAHSMTHFLMMGLNPKTLGVWNGDDVNFSHSFTTKAMRTEGNLIIIKDRIQQYGPVGLMKLFVKKNLTNYNDGTMAWQFEGGFYREVHGENALVRAFYGIDETGTNNRENDSFKPLYHLIWIAMLLGCALQFFAKDISSTERVLMISLTLLSGFLMIFEARARYLIPLLPLYVILGVSGWLKFARRLLP